MGAHIMRRTPAHCVDISRYIRSSTAEATPGPAQAWPCTIPRPHALSQIPPASRPAIPPLSSDCPGAQLRALRMLICSRHLLSPCQLHASVHTGRGPRRDAFLRRGTARVSHQRHTPHCTSGDGRGRHIVRSAPLSHLSYLSISATSRIDFRPCGHRPSCTLSPKPNQTSVHAACCGVFFASCVGAACDLACDPCPRGLRAAAAAQDGQPDGSHSDNARCPMATAPDWRIEATIAHQAVMLRDRQRGRRRERVLL